MPAYLKPAQVVMVASKRQLLGADEPLPAGEVQKAEEEARTPSEHLRLAAYYRLEAKQAQKKWVDAEDKMKHWGWMDNWTKIPNPRWSAKTQAEAHRAKFDRATQLTFVHEKMAQSLQASGAIVSEGGVGISSCE